MGSSAGSGSCTPCNSDGQDPRLYSLGTVGTNVADTCVQCDTTKRAEGGTNNVGHTQCNACGEGYECNGTNTRTQCLAGWSAAENDGVCAKCSAGRYSASDGAADCTACNSGEDAGDLDQHYSPGTTVDNMGDSTAGDK